MKKSIKNNKKKKKKKKKSEKYHPRPAISSSNYGNQH